MSDSEKLQCPGCLAWKPVIEFDGLPVGEKRCQACVPVDQAMRIQDLRVKKAGQVIAKLFDANEAGKGLRPLEQMVSQGYDAWGGPVAFMEDVVTWIKDMGDHPKTKPQAVQAALKLLGFHAKVDRMKLEDDWKQMDDETLKATLIVRMTELLSGSTPESLAKGAALKAILGQEEIGD